MKMEEVMMTFRRKQYGEEEIRREERVPRRKTSDNYN